VLLQRPSGKAHVSHIGRDLYKDRYVASIDETIQEPLQMYFVKFPSSSVPLKARTPAFIPRGLKTGAFFGSIATAGALGRGLVSPLYEPAEAGRAVKVCGALGPDRRGLGGATPLLSPG